MRIAAQDRDVMINGLRLHYRQWGNVGRRPLLLLHASGCHAHWWNEVGPLLAADFDVCAPDWRAHGEWANAPGAYHNLMLDNLTGFVEAVRGFLLGAHRD